MRTVEHTKWEGIVCGLLLALIVVPLGLFAQSNGPTLLFKSGFEKNTTLGPVTGIAPDSIEQTLGGTDLSTGFSWPLLVFNPNPGLTGIHLIPYSGATDPLANHFFNAIDGTQAHSGSSSLLLKLDGYPQGSCCAQDTFDINGMSQSITSMYQRIWIKLQPDFQTQVQTYRGNFWRVMWEFKTTSDYRTAAYIYGDANGNAYWHVHADNLADGGVPPWVTYWSVDNHTIPVPLNQWFLMEVYLKRSTASDGRFFWAVNGQTIADRMGPNYGANNEAILGMFLQNVYGNYFPMYQWVDDFEIWDAPPCANLPCGTQPAAPTNLTITVQ
jgi:hypothetical protein